MHKLGNILGNFENLNDKTLTAQGFHGAIQRSVSAKYFITANTLFKDSQ